MYLDKVYTPQNPANKAIPRDLPALVASNGIALNE